MTDALPPAGRRRAAQPPDVHRRRRRAGRPAELLGPGARHRRLELRPGYRAASRSPSRACSPPCERLLDALGRAAAAGAVARGHRQRPERPGGADRRAGGARSRHWLRCTACNELAPSTRAPSASRTTSRAGPTRRSSCTPSLRAQRKPPRGAGPLRARCMAGHLDDFPYVPLRPQGRRVPRGGSTRGCGWRTAAATSAPTSRSGA